jgi:hypothetical protein
MMSYTPGEYEIIDAWATFPGEEELVLGVVLSQLIDGNVNLLDHFATIVDEEWLNKLAKIVERVELLSDVTYLEGDFDEQEEDDA